MNEYAVERLLGVLQSLTNEVQLFREAYVAHYSPKLERIAEPNSSEKPNNSTRSKMEQVDKDINVRSKDEPQTDEEYINNLPWTEVGNGEQTDCPWK